MEMEERFHTAAAACGQLAPVLQAVPSSIQLEVQEIRFRAGRPISLSLPGRTLFLTGRGDVVRTATPSCFLPSQSVLEDVFRSMCAFSVYSHQNEIRNGYVTLRGGHRAGICGTAVMDRGVMTGIRNVSSINIRIAREIRGAADE